MFEYIALRFESTLLDFELMEKSQVIFAEPLLVFRFLTLLSHVPHVC
jgi:hypothetical protein